jgi:hypothetical protein
MKIRMLHRVLAAVATGVLASALLAAPSHAVVLDGNCEFLEGYIYKNASFADGGVRDTSSDMSNYSGYNFTYGCALFCGLNDAVSSVRNKKDASMYLFEHSFGGGGQVWVSAQWTKSSLGDLNDELSSHCWWFTSRPSWCL